MKNYKKISLFTLLFLLLLNIGFASWVIVNSSNTFENNQIAKKEESKPVAYTYENNIKKQFTTIESALKCTNSGTIYVVSGTDPVITSDCTIKEGVTLALPYEDDGENTHKILLEKGNNGNTFADNDTSKRNNLLTIDKATLEVKGTLQIGGVTGGTGVQGATTGAYSEILMKSANMIVTGNVECYGFIKEDNYSNLNESMIIFDKNENENFSSASITTPTVFYDYSSATNLLKIYNNKVFPFNQFDVPQIRVTMKFYYGSKLVGRVHTYGDSAGDILASPNLLATDDAFVCMNEGSYVIWKYSDTDSSKTSKAFKNHSTSISLFGNGIMGHLSVQIKIRRLTIPIDSKDYYLPVPYGYNINLKSESSFTIPSSLKGIKFLPGSSFLCEENSVLNIDTGALFYQNTTASDGTTFNYVSTVQAKLVNNGNVNINSGFEGNIDTDDIEGNAKLNIGSGYTTISNCKEGTSSSVFSWGGAKAKVSTNNEIPTDYSVLTSNSAYKSKDKYWIINESKEIKRIQLVSKSYASKANTKGDFDISLSIDPIDHDCTILDYSWDYSPKESSTELLKVSDDKKTAHLTTPANSNTEANKTYTVYCTIKYRDSDGNEKDTKGQQTYTATMQNSCVSGDTLISMADGSYKMIKDITYDDEILAVDHFSGQIVKTKAAIIFKHEASFVDKVKLLFDDGTYVDVLGNHEFFDLTLNKYVEINVESYSKYIGHDFAKINSNMSVSSSAVKLYNVTVTSVNEVQYSIQSAVQINFITNGILSRTVPAVTGWFDYFDFGDMMKYNEDKVADDINQYGLYEYEDFEYLGVTYEQFIAFNGPYLKILVGKGIVTYEDILNLISEYVVN